MKISNSLLLGASVLFFSCTEVEQAETPEQVLQSFGTMFPNANNVEWEHEDEAIWEAEFTIEEKEYEAEFNESGQWLETDVTLIMEEVPKAVLTGISAKYPNSEWVECEEVKKENFLAYEVTIVFENEEMEILISGSGQILAPDANAKISKGNNTES